jgi:hypothetical protein
LIFFTSTDVDDYRFQSRTHSVSLAFRFCCDEFSSRGRV